MSAWDNLIGRSYLEGRTDCYGLVRDYFEQEWGMSLPNLARPTRFWEAQLNLYEAYEQFGFELLSTKRYQKGDVLLMPIRTPVDSHAAVVVDDNLILHHLPGQLSRTDALRPRWSNRVTTAVRHPEISKRLKGAGVTVRIERLLNAPILRRRDVQAEIAREVERRG